MFWLEVICFRWKKVSNVTVEANLVSTCQKRACGFMSAGKMPSFWGKSSEFIKILKILLKILKILLHNYKIFGANFCEVRLHLGLESIWEAFLILLLFL